MSAQRSASSTVCAPRKISKLLVANRGEIAIRVFRACKEMGIRSVAVYSEEDKHALHRTKADEAYMIGKDLTPVAAYLNIPEILQLAKDKHVDAIHPGYGFMSERADFAEACENAGLTFIGPSSNVVALMGDKVEARHTAIKAGVSVVPGLDSFLTSAAEIHQFAKDHGLPVMLKAAYGGGGRGVRAIYKDEDIDESYQRATHEALTAFGNGSLFLEKCIEHPRHIEVQVMGDSLGNVCHLFERDCSVQRRHQKLIEIAPAPHLKPEVREAILAEALRLVKYVGYKNAGTVEFLLDQKSNKFYFMEVNARLQVEHTVSEEITGIDLVRTQIRVAEGASLEELGLTQSNIHCNGFAIQCRVTTEDPAKDFQPDFGRIEVFKGADGCGIRTDAAFDCAGGHVTPFYDSLIVKLISNADTFKKSASKMHRALCEVSIGGVKTNIGFLKNVMENEEFLTGVVDTSFIAAHPELLASGVQHDKEHQLLRYLGRILVNGPATMLATGLPPAKITPTIPTFDESAPYPSGWRNVLLEKGPTEFAKLIRQHKQTLFTDTTMRDAHQSLLATRVRTHDLERISPFVRQNLSQLFSLENWGGATFDSSMRFLSECPWDRLIRLRKQIPNIPFQMLLRGANAVGYTNYPDNVVYKFCELAVKAGMDVFRVFDCLNYVPNLVVGMDAVNKAGGVVEGAICYTGDICNAKKTKYTLEYYLDLVDQLVKAGTHILGIKDMAGLLKPDAATLLVKAIHDRYPDLPIHVHTHDTSGAGVATQLAAAKAGADIVDVAIDSMSGITSQPSMGAVAACLANTELDTGLDAEALIAYSAYWEQARTLYRPFECTVTIKAGNADIYKCEIPGGQYTNLQFQAFSLGLADQFEKIKKSYREANSLLGDIVKVTPSSKVVGDLAQYMVQNKLTEQDVLDRAEELSFPKSVIEYFEGVIGLPYGGFPEPLASHVLRGKKALTERAGLSMPPVDFNKIREDLKEQFSRDFDEYEVMSAALYPKVFCDFEQFRSMYGATDRLATREFFVGPDVGEEFDVELTPGRKTSVKLLAIGPMNANNTRTVFFELNGQPRSLEIEDKSTAEASQSHPKADKSNKGSIGAPMPGEVIELRVKEGESVEKGQPLATLSAMKMETSVTAPKAGTVVRVLVTKGMKIQGDDLMFLLE